MVIGLKGNQFEWWSGDRFEW